jgi:hypothetical protein
MSLQRYTPLVGELVKPQSEKTLSMLRVKGSINDSALTIILFDKKNKKKQKEKIEILFKLDRFLFMSFSLFLAYKSNMNQ